MEFSQKYLRIKCSFFIERTIISHRHFLNVENQCTARIVCISLASRRRPNVARSQTDKLSPDSKSCIAYAVILLIHLNTGKHKIFSTTISSLALASTQVTNLHSNVANRTCATFHAQMRHRVFSI